MHVYDAHIAWLDDHREIQAKHEERMRLRERDARSAILRVAALALCAERGHDRKLRGCEDCREDVAAVWPEMWP